MPRKDYKTITVKNASMKRFLDAKKKSGLDNSEFTDLLVKNYNEKYFRIKKAKRKL